MTRSSLAGGRWRPLLAAAWTVCACAWLPAWSQVAAQASPAATEAASPQIPLPPERFFQNPAVRDAKLSPSGRRLAITTTRGAGRVALVVLELLPTPHALQATAFNDADVSNFDWTGENRLVFNVVDLESGSGEDRRLAPGLFSVNADGSDLRTLIKRRNALSASSADRSALDWNRTLLHVPLPQDGVNADEVVVGEMAFDANGLVAMKPLWLNVLNGRTRRLETAGAPLNAVGWLFDSKGQPRAAVTRSDRQRVIHWRGPGDDAWRELARHDPQNPAFSLAAVDDGGTLYVTHTESPGGLWVLTRFDFKTMAPESPALLRSPGFDFRGGVVLDRAGSRALGVRVETDAEQTVWFDPAMRRFQALADERLPGRVNRINCRRCGADDMVALVYSFSDQDPGGFWLHESATQRWTRISNRLDGVEPARMAHVDLQRIKARDGRELPVWLTLPPGVPAGQPAPAVVMVHGGPWLRGGYWRWQPMEQFLASRGYIVISPEFRGSAGYGEAHYKAGWKQWGQAMQDDVADALRWAQAQGLASKQACIAGSSYGGYSALMGLVRDSGLYRCGIAWVALTDPFLFLKGSFWIDDDTSSQVRRHALPELVGDADKDAAMLTAASPLAQAARIKAPLLLAFGDSDRRVPLAHGERLRDAMKAGGNPPDWVVYSDEGHSWRQVATQVDFARRMEQFLARNLTGAGQ